MRPSEESTLEREHSFTQDELGILSERGYVPIEPVGVGNTREAFRVMYSHGDVKKTRILKRAKTEIDTASSITATINASKKDIHLAEVRVAEKIDHPNVAEIVDSFVINERRYNVERDYHGRDLETEVNIRGPINTKEARERITYDLIQGVNHLHERGMLHRDIKPSNVLVTPEGRTILTDLQNVGRMQDMEPTMVPTRGGTAYTRPRQLNSLLSGSLYVGEPKDDIHALGATLHFMLTGKPAFDYSLKNSPEGKKITVGDSEIGVTLEVDGRAVSEIDEKMRTEQLKRVKQDLKKAKVPRPWRNLVTRCLSDEDNSFRSLDQVMSYYDRIKSSPMQKIKDAALKSLPIAGIGGLLSGIILWGVYGWKHEPAPKLKDIMGDQSYREYSLESVQEEMGRFALVPFVDSMKRSKERLSKLETESWLLKGDELANFVGRQYMDVRLGTSILRAGYVVGNDTRFMQKDETVNMYILETATAPEQYRQSGDERVYPGFVPVRFFRVNSPSMPLAYAKGKVDSFEDTEKLASALDYLKISAGRDTDRDGKVDVLDAITGFYTSTQDMNVAKARAFNITRERKFIQPAFPPKETTHLPYIAWNAGIHNSNSGAGDSGWGAHLPRYQEELINTALGLYMITDEEGRIHWDRIPEVTTQINMPMGYSQEVRLNSSQK